MNYGDIRTALDTAVSAVVGIPPVTYENEMGVPVSGKPFTRTTLLPARPNQLTVGVTGRDELIGNYQIDLYFPLGSGATATAVAADALVDAFPRSWSVTNGGVVLRATRSWIEAGRTVNNWYTVAVMVSWSCIR